MRSTPLSPLFFFHPEFILLAAARAACGLALLRPRKTAGACLLNGGYMFFRTGRTRFPPGSRVNGAGLGRALERIELDLPRDRHARAAMEAYADSCASELPWLSEALRLSPFGRAERLTQCSSTVLRVFVTAQARAAVQPDYAHAAWEHVRSHLTALLSAPAFAQVPTQAPAGDANAHDATPPAHESGLTPHQS